MNYRLVKKESQIHISLMRSEKTIWVYQKLKRKFLEKETIFQGGGHFELLLLRHYVYVAIDLTC